ncbi:OmpA family protein [Photobacterium sp. CCB-ST2H9]|uniref:flagellar motor protein MotB n=1 Tax=unclassified Photobacterium TaxID=2628852 RepID=UPI0020034E0A|nr:flagellar motor protein MotB [Photobacterium sp. CCB-ST2H9]UTM58900.1 OmpA family protein [Photobacterium sp. CCB-ST2H9]
MQRYNQIIIKRRRQNDHDVGHGGAWKVAFADFMIALMALFLVLWILAIVDQSERKAIVAHLNSSSLFDQGVGNPFDSSTSLSPIDLGGEASDLSSHNAAVTVTSFYDGNGDGQYTESLVQGTYDSQEQLKVLAKVVEELAKQASAEGNVHVDVTPQGLRIVLQDDFRENMFHRGSSQLTPFFEDLLLALAPIFKKIENPLIISGHTDAIRYSRSISDKTNWELSASRANVARQTLIAGGAPEKRVLQVAGMADKAPLNPETPSASENRRIELFVLTAAAARMVETLFRGPAKHEDGPVLQQARKEAEFNQPVIRQDFVKAS